jgi:hypothetical protein
MRRVKRRDTKEHEGRSDKKGRKLMAGGTTILYDDSFDLLLTTMFAIISV